MRKTPLGLWKRQQNPQRTQLPPAVLAKRQLPLDSKWRFCSVAKQPKQLLRTLIARVLLPALTLDGLLSLDENGAEVHHLQYIPDVLASLVSSKFAPFRRRSAGLRVHQEWGCEQQAQRGGAYSVVSHKWSSDEPADRPPLRISSSGRPAHSHIVLIIPVRPITCPPSTPLHLFPCFPPFPSLTFLSSFKVLFHPSLIVLPSFPILYYPIPSHSFTSLVFLIIPSHPLHPFLFISVPFHPFVIPSHTFLSQPSGFPPFSFIPVFSNISHPFPFLSIFSHPIPSLIILIPSDPLSTPSFPILNILFLPTPFRPLCFFPSFLINCHPLHPFLFISVPSILSQPFLYLLFPTFRLPSLLVHPSLFQYFPSLSIPSDPLSSPSLLIPYHPHPFRSLNPRPFSVFRHLRQWRGWGWYDPPGDRPLMVVELLGKKQSTRLDEISRLHMLFLVLGQHLI